MRRGLSLLVVALAALVWAPTALAHPLGNFTTNQLSRVEIDEGKARIDYVLDLAEIPTVRLVQRHDADGDGAIAGAERGPYTRELVGEIEGGLRLEADGREVSLDAGAAALSFPEGQAGLDLTRLEVSLAGDLPPEASRVELANSAFEGTTGWNAIQIQPGTGTDVTSSVPASDPTNGLRSYPADLLASPPETRSATLDVQPGTGRVDAPDGITGGATTEDRAQDGFANLLAGGDTAGWAILLLLGAAFGWGALHALSPGHGKAMVAGYLVGARGTPRHAAILGATVTITHTAAVFALGLVTLAASQYVLPEQLYPWLTVASGLAVVAIGFAVMRSRFRRWRAMRADAAGGHTHVDSHGHAHTHSHDHEHGHAHGHHHHPPADEPITMRSLIALGVSGGIIPCPSALVVLVAAISQHRLGLGMVLIFAFSLGLAATLTAVGLAVIWGGRALQRVRPDRRLFGGRFTGAVPAVSATVIVLAGVLITVRAIPALG